MPHSDPQEYKAYQKSYRLKNAAKLRLYAREWRSKNKDTINAKRRDGSRKEESKRYYHTIEKFRSEAKKPKRRAQRYGLTDQEFQALLTKQGFACALCIEPLKMGTKSVHIDHDHKTKRVRGILCARCNLGLGRFGDDIEGLKAAIRYLESGEG